MSAFLTFAGATARSHHRRFPALYSLDSSSHSRHYFGGISCSHDLHRYLVAWWIWSDAHVSYGKPSRVILHHIVDILLNLLKFRDLNISTSYYSGLFEILLTIFNFLETSLKFITKTVVV